MEVFYVNKSIGHDTLALTEGQVFALRQANWYIHYRDNNTPWKASIHVENPDDAIESWKAAKGLDPYEDKDVGYLYELGTHSFFYLDHSGGTRPHAIEASVKVVFDGWKRVRIN